MPATRHPRSCSGNSPSSEDGAHPLAGWGIGNRIRSLCRICRSVRRSSVGAYLMLICARCGKRGDKRSLHECKQAGRSRLLCTACRNSRYAWQEIEALRQYSQAWASQQTCRTAPNRWHPFDIWALRMYRKNRGNILAITKDGVIVNGNKIGNVSRSGPTCRLIENPVSPVYACDLCGRLGTKRMVRERLDSWQWNAEDDKRWWETPDRDCLCTGCWNKVRVVVRRKKEAALLKRLVNKLKRSIEKCQK